MVILESDWSLMLLDIEFRGTEMGARWMEENHTLERIMSCGRGGKRNIGRQTAN
jgi:hypothetical protein